MLDNSDDANQTISIEEYKNKHDSYPLYIPIKVEEISISCKSPIYSLFINNKTK